MPWTLADFSGLAFFFPGLRSTGFAMVLLLGCHERGSGPRGTSDQNGGSSPNELDPPVAHGSSAWPPAGWPKPPPPCCWPPNPPCCWPPPKPPPPPPRGVRVTLAVA